ncbi:MAG: biotin/lipoyl-binding protein [Pseudomonadota bacterium]
MTRAQFKIVLPVLVLLIAGGIYYGLVISKVEKPAPELAEKAWQVQVLEIQSSTLSPEVTLYGRIESPEQLRSASPGSGVVEKVFVRNGDRVIQGQPLVTLDSRDFVAMQLQSKADMRDFSSQINELKIRHQANLQTLKTEQGLLQLAQDEVERLVKLKAQNLSADTALNNARSELERRRLTVTARELEVDSFSARQETLQARRDRAEAQLSMAELALTRADLKAPFDAIISEVRVASGDRVSTGDILVSLFPIQALEIRAHLPVRYIARVKQAISQSERLKAESVEPFAPNTFILHRLAGEAEATGIDVYFKIETNDEQFRPGELVTLRLQLPAEKEVFALPYQAIYGNSRIYRVEDGRLNAIDVTTIGQTRNSDNQVQVLIRAETLNSGDQVAVTHLPNAISGLKVSISVN